VKTDRAKKKKTRNTLIAYAFMAPALILLIVFVFLPIIYSIPLAFFDYSVIGETKFIGWANFSRAINDNEFWISIKNSLMFVLVVPPIQILSILLALLVNRKLRGISIFRALFYIPVVTSMIAVSITWDWIFRPNGVINTFLMNIGLLKMPVLWLADPKLALLSMMFITLWQGLGYYMMIYLAGLQSIPVELEEAAMVDGANKSQTLFKIKIPMLKPYVWFCSLVSVLAAVRVFDVIFALKDDGGPNNATLVSSLFTYRKAFVNFEFGYSAAIGLLVSIVLAALSAIVFMYGKRGGMGYYHD
jgi:putative chitobiose transport system permease protein